MKMNNLDRCNEIMQCIERLYNDCDLQYHTIEADLDTIFDNIKRIKAELFYLWHECYRLNTIDLIDRTALLQDMTQRGGMGIGDWRIFDIISEQPPIMVQLEGDAEDDQKT